MLKKRTNTHIILTLFAAALLLLSAIFLSSCGSSSQTTSEEIVKESSFAGKIKISELMYHNTCSLQDESGAFPDWIELHNLSEENIDLSGWMLSDGEAEQKWVFPQYSIAPDEYLLIFCSSDNSQPMECNFSLSEGETLYLYDVQGVVIDSAFCSAVSDDVSLALNSQGQLGAERWISPGFENSHAGYEAYASSHTAIGPLSINEAMVYSDTDEDWVEIKNLSDSPVNLSSFYLSDDEKELKKWQFPDIVLEGGKYRQIFCSGDESLSDNYKIHCNFSLDSESESLFLSDSSGNMIDYVHLHSIPSGGSMGRLADRNGFFYFEIPTPGADNNDGKRRVSDSPYLLTKDGVFNNTQSVTAELAGSGVIYYSTDGSLPTEDSEQYSSPLSFDSTSVLRAVAVEEDALPSPAVSYSFILNENHSLPVLSLVVDKPTEFRNMYLDGFKGKELQANLALYNDTAEFNHRCSVSMKGFTSLSLPKKSLGIAFKGCHGGKLNCDVFGNGIDEFSNLSIRAGQDYTFSIIRNELFQELCLQGSDSLYTQASKYCVLYVNGQYYGLFCLKEDLNSQFYASHAGVSRSSVESIKFPAPMGSSFWNEVLDFCWNNDMSVQENYNQLCSVLDVDSLIDWTIFEGYSANTDIQGNLKIFRSPENGNKWQFSFYDLDWGFYSPEGDFTILLKDQGNTGYLMPSLIKALLNNPSFRNDFLTRFKELNEGVLSNENVLAEIDRLQALIDPEVERDRIRWDLDYDSWLYRVDELRSYILDYDREIHNIDQICALLDVSDEERMEIFGR